MQNIKKLYRKNIYGVMGTLIFHIGLVSIFLVAELKTRDKIELEEDILLEFTAPEEKTLEPEPDYEKIQKINESFGQSLKNIRSSGSNKAVNDATKSDKFFDDNYRRDIVEAENLVSDVKKQLSKKPVAAKKFEMPEANTVGKNQDSIKNVIYSGKSNIHYFLVNRFHIRLPIPVYLARGGGTIIVDIQVNRSGKVVKAEARPANNINDPMLPAYATQAAERTVFNSESKAAEIQKGTITYRFVAQ
jgi:hypothetical protein